ncbi:MAG: hypothetical protein AAFP13_10630 [Pseudomonadota bacterium]
MLEEKRVDLEAEKQKRLLARMVETMTREHADLYYQPTSQIALVLHQDISKGAGLTLDEKGLVDKLSSRDIEVLLSHR